MFVVMLVKPSNILSSYSLLAKPLITVIKLDGTVDGLTDISSIFHCERNSFKMRDISVRLTEHSI